MHYTDTQIDSFGEALLKIASPSWIRKLVPPRSPSSAAAMKNLNLRMYGKDTMKPMQSQVAPPGAINEAIAASHGAGAPVAAPVAAQEPVFGGVASHFKHYPNTSNQRVIGQDELDNLLRSILQ